MPRDLFGTVTRPSISIGNRKWYTVPVSLLSHAIILAMIVIVPILAAPMMPGVLDSTALVRFIEVVPPTPPPPPIIHKTAPRPIEQPCISVEAPTGFHPEQPPIEPGWEGKNPGTIDGLFGTDASPLTPPPPRVVQKAPGPLRVGGTIRQPVKVRHVDPVYPAIAQAARVQGFVIIEATLSPDGRVSNARVLRSIPLLDQAALEAVRQWEYTPTLLNGIPVPVIMTITVMFTLAK